VILIIDALTGRLTSTIADKSNLPVVCATAACGLKVLNKYYSAMDDSIMYWVAMGKPSRRRVALDYFRCQKWKPLWLCTTKDLVREQWAKHYR
ncbi:hypothetical protein BC629DRAFT_1274089, partial [Irpex lacteus]